MNELISLDPTAVRALEQWIADDPRPGLAFRVSVESGGCSGLRYEVILDDGRGPGDIVTSCRGVDVVCDPRAARYVLGARISFSENGFRVTNPNARGACMCGASFSALV